MGKYLLSITLLFQFFIISPLFSQNRGDRPSTNAEFNKTVETYFQVLGDHAVILNNPWNISTVGVYVQSMFLRPGGYLELDTWGHETFPKPYVDLRESYTAGELLYDGIFYPNMMMRLDQYRDLLFVLGKGIEVTLDPSKLDYATVQDYKIIYIGKDSGIPVANGYYQELYSGKYSVLKKTSYLFSESENKFTTTIRKYYILKDGVPYQVQKRRDIAKVLGVQTKELKREADKIGLGFKPDNQFERTLIFLVKTFENN